VKHTASIKDALAHYRCPACGAVNPGFIYKELLVCTFRLDPKARWQLSTTSTLEDEGYADYEGDTDDFYTFPVRCGHCQEPVRRPDGSQVNALDCEGWLEDLGRRWVAMQQERAVLLVKLKEEEDGLPPLGLLESLKERIEALGFIA
jgi:hypothetical protein